MSLIQEALRRQQEEAGKSSETPSVAPPPIQEPTETIKDVAPPSQQPPPVQSTPQPTEPPAPINTEENAQDEQTLPPSVLETTPPSQKAWIQLLAVVSGIVVILGALAWGSIYAYHKWITGKNETKNNSDQMATDIAKNQKTGDLTNSPIQAVDVESITKIKPVQVTDNSEQTPSQIVPKQTAPVIVAPTHPPIKKQETAPPPEPTQKYAVWPEIAVSGVVGAGHTGSAIVNGEILGVGESVLGVKIVSIEKQAIKVTFQGEERTLKVGQAATQ